MKKLSLIMLSTVAFLFLATSCQRNSQDMIAFENDNRETTEVMGKDNPGPCNPSAYNVVLESRTLVNGYWEWIWSIQNTNPGNGNNGTAQDLSNWGMELGSCVNWASVISAGFSIDGTTWSDFTPLYQANPGQGCLTTPVLKFDLGTTGTAKSYYRVILDQDVQPGTVVGVYKSGSSTSCCIFSFNGIGCGGPVEIVE